MSTQISKNFNFRGVILFENKFIINDFRLTLNMTVQSESPREQNIAMDRIEWFLTQKVDSSLLINEDKQENIDLFHKAGFGIVTLPKDPYDQIIGMVLICKINAFLENKLEIESLVIESLLSDGIKFTIDLETAKSILQGNYWYNNSSTETNDLTNDNYNTKIVKLFDNQWNEIGLTWKEKREKKVTKKLD